MCIITETCQSHKLDQLNNCIMTHIYREGNRAANKLAQIGHQQEKPQIWQHIHPNGFLRIVDEDVKGKIILCRR